MIEKENKKYYSCRELADFVYDNREETIELADIWRKTFASHDNFKVITSAQFQSKLMPLARSKKLPHLECTKTSSERFYYFFNIDDIISHLSGLSSEDSIKYSTNFTNIELVEAE